MTQTEADRIKTHLRKWQSDHATTCRQPQNNGTPRPAAPQPTGWIAQAAYRPARTEWPVSR